MRLGAARRGLVAVGSTLAVAGVLLLVLGALDGGVAAPATTDRAAAAATAPPDGGQPSPDDVAAGEQLYLTGCVSCHAVGGVGTELGPPVVDSGAAYADFMLRTGRMPLAVPAAQSPQKPVAYSDQQIRQLVAYVASLGDGPPIPDVQPDRGDLSEGSQLFLSNCAACHNASGIGGALSYGNEAPSLMSVEPTQIGEAIRVGPGQMPVFGPETFDDRQVDSIARYVGELQDPEHPGGLRLGGAGPVPEGFVAWLVGLGGLLVLTGWITSERG